MTISGLQDEQDRAAAARVREREGARAENLRVLGEPGGIARADSRERVARRMDRLASYHLGEALPARSAAAPAADPESVMRAAAQRVADSDKVPAVAPQDAEDPDRVLERVIADADFLEFRYLEAGTVAGRAVGRVVLRDEQQRPDGYGTGSLVWPRLLLTNHHVLPDAATAAQSAVQFNFQYGLDGKPLAQQQFGFDPGAFFVADVERDFALVAVDATAEQLAQFGFNPLIAAEGKVIVGERVTIVQHPAGEMKRIALRDQQVVDVADTPFLYYLADTEHGSSGSPVFNDQWEVVALHHAGVPKSAVRDAPAGTPAYVNEGVRVSRILQFLDAAPLTDAQRALMSMPATGEPPASASEAARISPTTDGWAQTTVQLQIRVRPASTPDAAPQVEVTLPPGSD